MEKSLKNFVAQAKNGEKIFIATSIVVVACLVIGIILGSPIFWMGEKYETTWMSNVTPYLFYIFEGYTALIILLFMPYMWYVGTSKKYTGDRATKILIKSFAITACTVLPGILMYGFISKQLFIPTGSYNIIGAVVCGLFYMKIVNIIFKKPFSKAQEFLPLN